MTEEAKELIRDAFIFGNDDDPNFKTRKMLDEHKETMLRMPEVEVYENESGEIKESKLIYNTKTKNPNSQKKYKTVLCTHLQDCWNGENCWYAHSEEELENYTIANSCVQRSKQRAKCVYAHEPEELRKKGAKKITDDELLGLPEGFAAAAKSGIEKAKALEGIPLDHHEPCQNQLCPLKTLCQNQLCPLKLRSLLRNTVICEFWEKTKCTKGASCTYAHGEEELEPLPKYEFCVNFDRNLCPLESSECVYAHQPEELRKKGAKKITDVEPSGLTEGFAAAAKSGIEKAKALERMVSEGPEQLCDICEELKNSLPYQTVKRHVAIVAQREDM